MPAPNKKRKTPRDKVKQNVLKKKEVLGASAVKHEIFLNRLLEGVPLGIVCAELGYNENYGSQLLRKSNIQTELQRRRRELADKSDLSAGRVVRELCCLAASDIGDVLPEDGDMGFAKIKALPRHVRAAIQSVSCTPTKFGPSWKVKLHPKQPALDRLAEMLGLFEELPPLDVLLNRLPPDTRARLESGLLTMATKHPEARRGLPTETPFSRPVPDAELGEATQPPSERDGHTV